MITKLYIKQRGNKSFTLKSKLPRKEAIAQWQQYTDPLNLMPFMRKVTFVAFTPLWILALVFAILTDTFMAIGRMFQCFYTLTVEFCDHMTDNHTTLSLEDSDRTSVN